MKERKAYLEWAMEYLSEAEVLRKRLGTLRVVPVKERGDALSQRISMLSEMYQECMHTGKLLQERGKRV